MKSFRLAVLVAILSGLLGGVAAAEELPFGFSIAGAGMMMPEGQQVGVQGGAFIAPLKNFEFGLTFGRMGPVQDTGYGLTTTTLGFETTYQTSFLNIPLNLVGLIQMGFNGWSELGVFGGLKLPFHQGSTDRVAISFLAGRPGWQPQDEAAVMLQVEWAFAPQMFANWFR